MAIDHRSSAQLSGPRLIALSGGLVVWDRVELLSANAGSRQCGGRRDGSRKEGLSYLEQPKARSWSDMASLCWASDGVYDVKK